MRGTDNDDELFGTTTGSMLRCTSTTRARAGNMALLTADTQAALNHLKDVARMLQYVPSADPDDLDYAMTGPPVPPPTDGDDSGDRDGGATDDHLLPPGLLRLRNVSHNVHGSHFALPNDSALSEHLEDSVRGLGEYVDRLVNEVIRTVEEQMLLVFRENKDKQRAVEREVESITRRQWDSSSPAPAAVSPPRLPTSPQVADVHSPSGAAGAPSPARVGVGGAASPPPVTSPPPRGLTDRLGLKPKDVKDGCSSLGAFMQCFVDSIASYTGAERGIVYLCDQDAQFLRCVATTTTGGPCTGGGVPTGDVSLASAHLPCTILHTGIAVNVGAGHGLRAISCKEVLAIPIPGIMQPKDPGRTAEGDHPTSTAAAAPVPQDPDAAKTHTLCKGRPACGVICLYDKRGPNGFQEEDENFLVHCCGLLSAALQTYPYQCFLPKTFDPGCLSRLRTAQHKSPTTSVDDLLQAQNYNAVGDQLVLRIGKESGLSTVKDGLAAAAPMSLATELKEAVHYIESLEMMWRSSINDKRDLQVTLDSVQRKLTQSNYQLSYLETTLRNTEGGRARKTEDTGGGRRRGSAASRRQSKADSPAPPQPGTTRFPRIQHRSVKQHAPAGPASCAPAPTPGGFGAGGPTPPASKRRGVPRRGVAG